MKPLSVLNGAQPCPSVDTLSADKLTPDLLLSLQSSGEAWQALPILY